MMCQFLCRFLFPFGYPACPPVPDCAKSQNDLRFISFVLKARNRVANDALSQLSYTPTVRVILANARSATKRDSDLDCHAERTFFACAITSAAFEASATLPCAKSFAPPPLPPNCFRVSRSNAPISCANPFVCAKNT